MSFQKGLFCPASQIVDFTQYVVFKKWSHKLQVCQLQADLKVCNVEHAVNEFQLAVIKNILK